MRRANKRQADFQIISNWIDPRSRVLDLGCGRGVLLEHLQQTKEVTGVGVDTDLRKIQSCVRRGVNVYQGDAEKFLRQFPDEFFDWVILSRTLPEMPNPESVVAESLRVGKTLAVGFINHAYWLNRWAVLRKGHRIRNEVYPNAWYEDNPSNPVSIHGFEAFCREKDYKIKSRSYLGGDWKSPLKACPNLRAGYAVYAISR